jgi:hypothetical protein
MGTKEDDEAEIAQEEREEPKHEWMKANREYLRDEFIEQNQDKFDEFCEEEYKTLEE